MAYKFGRMRGRPRKPTILKMMAGTYRPDRSPENEPAPKSEIGKAPDFLDDPQRLLWDEMVEESPCRTVDGGRSGARRALCRHA